MYTGERHGCGFILNIRISGQGYTKTFMEIWSSYEDSLDKTQFFALRSGIIVIKQP